MLGRVVLVLCAVSSPAFACPTARVASDDSTGAAVAFGFMGLCLFAYAIMRGNAVRRTFATSRHLVDVDIDVLRRVARAQRTRTIVLAAVCTLAWYAVTQLPLPVGARIWLGMSPLLLLAVAVIALGQLQMLIGLRPEPELRVASHGHYLYVSRGRRLVGWVAAPPKLVARVSALPVATLRT